MPRNTPPMPALFLTSASDEIYMNLVVSALDRLRLQTFGNEMLKLFSFTPEAGETLVLEVTENWGARRVVSTTESGSAESGAWQFQIKADDDWPDSQDYMSQIVSMRVGSRRWKVKKVETPHGNFRFWRIKAEVSS